MPERVHSSEGLGLAVLLPQRGGATCAAARRSRPLANALRRSSRVEAAGLVELTFDRCPAGAAKGARPSWTCMWRRASDSLRQWRDVFCVGLT